MDDWTKAKRNICNEIFWFSINLELLNIHAMKLLWSEGAIWNSSSHIRAFNGTSSFSRGWEDETWKAWCEIVLTRSNGISSSDAVLHIMKWKKMHKKKITLKGKRRRRRREWKRRLKSSWIRNKLLLRLLNAILRGEEKYSQEKKVETSCRWVNSTRFLRFFLRTEVELKATTTLVRESKRRKTKIFDQIFKIDFETFF